MKSDNINKSNQKKFKRTADAVSVWKKEKRSRTDVLGSYTGVPSENNDEVPEQDSDDL